MRTNDRRRNVTNAPQVVILAAGMGSRLGRSLPKPLTAPEARRDGHHQDAVALWGDRSQPLVTTNLIVGETWTFLRRRLFALGLSGRALVIAAPALWLTIIFLLALLIVLQVSLSASVSVIAAWMRGQGHI